MKAKKIHVNGIVQGVGFRPFIYRIAHKYALKGYVQNLGDAGVEIFVEGKEKNIENFIHTIKTGAPPLAMVENMHIESSPTNNFDAFIIDRSSMKKSGENSIIPPDIAICDDCLSELFDDKNRRYMYPFIVCTNCGPRFSIIEELPYDRKNTMMNDFDMCYLCNEEYTNPVNRRYHAEPICCEDCGPRYELITSDGKKIKGNPIKIAASLIDQGKIVAIKGIGGFHIACDAKNDSIVEELRRRIGREKQPFAIMAKDIETVEKFANIGTEEKKEFLSYRRPIVLLRKKNSFSLPESLAPGLHTIGIMLPYAGVHYLLFHFSHTQVYVMTSANYPDFPMVKDNSKIGEIKNVADYFLMHNRHIANRVDDSVVRFVSGKRAVLRRSRGFVPIPINFPFKYGGLAMGAELMNSFALVKNGRIYPSQYIGNTSKIDVIKVMDETIERFRKLVDLQNFDLIMVDSHPLYNTFRMGYEIGEKMNTDVLKIQHHFAHIASILAESGEKEIIGIAIDGTGYGIDKNIWGGEIIALTSTSIRRITHIDYYPLPGGDLAAYYPLRSLIGILSREYNLDEIDKIVKRACPDAISHLPYREREFRIILKQMERKVNISYASSTGRFLDAIAVLLNIVYRRTYEGEPAMKLESTAIHGVVDLNFEIPYEDSIKVHKMIPQILNSSAPIKNIAYSVHLSIARALAKNAIIHAQEEGIKQIGVSGGVAYNSIIVREMKKIIQKNGLRFISTYDIPRGDNGISSGQAYLGGMYLNGQLRSDEIG